MSAILWAGSQESYDIVAAARITVAERIKAGQYDENNPQGLPALWEARGNTAVINISGALIDGSAGWMQLLGVVGYDDIAGAAIEAASSPDIKNLLFHINSPGGDVNGVMDLARVLSQVSALKNSAVYTSSQMCSGGYWLATGVQGPMLAGPTASVGSIGVVMVLTNVQAAMELTGIKKSVVRSGKYKAEINPYEEPTPEALARLQSQMDDVHDLFTSAVGKARPNLSADDLATVTEGQTFLGKRAKAAGLVDNVSSFDVALKLLDSQKPASDTSSNSKGKAMKITDLTPDQIAAISAGASPASFGVTEGIGGAAPAAPAAPAVAAVVEPAAAPAAAPAPVVAAAPDMASFYASQLATTQASLLASQVELTNLKASSQTMSANHEGLLAIARQSVGRMSIALGGSAAASEGLDAATAIAEFARVSATFNEKFKPGQVSAGAQLAADPKEANPIPAAFKYLAKHNSTSV